MIKRTRKFIKKHVQKIKSRLRSRSKSSVFCNSGKILKGGRSKSKLRTKVRKARARVHSKKHRKVHTKVYRKRSAKRRSGKRRSKRGGAAEYKPPNVIQDTEMSLYNIKRLLEALIDLSIKNELLKNHEFMRKGGGSLSKESKMFIKNYGNVENEDVFNTNFKNLDLQMGDIQAMIKGLVLKIGLFDGIVDIEKIRQLFNNNMGGSMLLNNSRDQYIKSLIDKLSLEKLELFIIIIVFMNMLINTEKTGPYELDIDAYAIFLAANFTKEFDVFDIENFGKAILTNRPQSTNGSYGKVKTNPASNLIKYIIYDNYESFSIYVNIIFPKTTFYEYATKYPNKVLTFTSEDVKLVDLSSKEENFTEISFEEDKNKIKQYFKSITGNLSFNSANVIALQIYTDGEPCGTKGVFRKSEVPCGIKKYTGRTRFGGDEYTDTENVNIILISTDPNLKSTKLYCYLEHNSENENIPSTGLYEVNKLTYNNKGSHVKMNICLGGESVSIIFNNKEGDGQIFFYKLEDLHIDLTDIITQDKTDTSKFECAPVIIPPYYNSSVVEVQDPDVQAAKLHAAAEEKARKEERVRQVEAERVRQVKENQKQPKLTTSRRNIIHRMTYPNPKSAPTETKSVSDQSLRVSALNTYNLKEFGLKPLIPSKKTIYQATQLGKELNQFI